MSEIWEYRYKKLKVAQVLGQLGVFSLARARASRGRATRRSAVARSRSSA
jgi:hypothetical protein